MKATLLRALEKTKATTKDPPKSLKKGGPKVGYTGISVAFAQNPY